LLHNYTEETALDDLLHPSMPMIHDPPKFQIQRLPGTLTTLHARSRPCPSFLSFVFIEPMNN
jgi:hypothetical protein